MDGFLDYLGALALQHPEWTKLIIGVGIIVQGEITTLLSLYLVIGKHITLAQFLISALTGLFVGETIIYLLGRKLRHTRFGWKLYRKIRGNRKIQLYTYYIKHRTGKILIVAKFLPGMNALTLFLMGWTRTSFKKFLRVYIPVALFWLSVTSFSAYAVTSGLHYLRSSKVFENIEIIIVGIIALFFIGEWVIKKIIASRIPENIPEIEEEEKNF
jgi:membrane protein DedA with SNARE-associated domain